MTGTDEGSQSQTSLTGGGGERPCCSKHSTTSCCDCDGVSSCLTCFRRFQHHPKASVQRFPPHVLFQADPRPPLHVLLAVVGERAAPHAWGGEESFSCQCRRQGSVPVARDAACVRWHCSFLGAYPEAVQDLTGLRVPMPLHSIRVENLFDDVARVTRRADCCTLRAESLDPLKPAGLLNTASLH